jgi:hypothetical protein
MEKGCSNPDRKIVELSRRLPAVFHLKEHEFGRRIPEKSENFPTRNTASMKLSVFCGTDLFLAVLSDWMLKKPLFHK